MLDNVLEKIRANSANTVQKGLGFEKLIKNYLQTEPQYNFSHVWLWKEWEHRPQAVDTGIDIVAKTLEGEYVAVQCKCYAQEHTLVKENIDSFFTASGQRFQTEDGERCFSQRLIITTTDKFSTHVSNALDKQSISVSLLGFSDLDKSPVDWEALAKGKVGESARCPKKKLRDHQQEALTQVLTGFATADRGKLVMACGTGKTFTALKIAEQFVPLNGKVLVLVPSIALLSQTLREWTAESERPLRFVAVCSDSKASKVDEDIHVYELSYPATTDVDKVVAQVKQLQQGISNELVVVFSTYQSIDVISAAQQQGLGEFDLVICDEAHRTTGVTLSNNQDSHFVKVHQQDVIQARKRLYMTATPRLFSDSAKKKAEENDAVLCSMDDEVLYGKTFYQLGFSKAVDLGLLSDYKVMILAVDENYVRRLGGQFDNDELVVEDKAKIIGCLNGLAKKTLSDLGDDSKPMRRAVAFAGTIDGSKNSVNLFHQVLTGEQSADLTCTAQHVDGKMNIGERNEKLRWLKEEPAEAHCRILSNARCLSEGVDVPALDAVIFLNPRNSIIDVVQSVGRVMRRAEGKQYGYVILPIMIPSNVSPEEALSDNKKYKVVWDVLQALRAHDDSFDATINKIDLNKSRPGKVTIDVIGAEPSKISEQGASYHNQGQLVFNADEWRNALYAKIVLKCGSRRYWETWAKDIADIAEKHIQQLNALSQQAHYQATFHEFVQGLQNNLNPSVSLHDAIEMLAQHLITKPIFDALFENYAFSKLNPVSQELQKILDKLDENKHLLEGESTTLNKFYESVRKRAKGIDNAEGKQKIIIELYDKFFKTAFPRMAERLGIVYTPVEVVDFIVHSVEVALRREFRKGLTDKGVHILDPFTGTGTFITRLLQSGLITKKDLPRKFEKELHANELVLLAYYIAAINIEEAYHELCGKAYQPFDGIVLTDTFQIYEKRDLVDETVLPENHARVEKQKQQPIEVIIGNPPYSAGQNSANDNNQNLAYPSLDDRITKTYAAFSKSTNKNSLYDSYIRAIRWASDRIQDKGIVAFVSNGSFIDGNAMDGVRKCLHDEFTSIYCFNLRGNARTSGEQRRMEKGNVFGEGTRTPIAITLLIKNPAKTEKCQLFYHDIGDYLSREKKLKSIVDFKHIDGIAWQLLTPNDKQDWINQRDEGFANFVSLGDKKDKTEKTFFEVYSRGIATSRDAWAYNFGKQALSKNMSGMIAFFNSQTTAYQAIPKEQRPEVDKFIDFDATKISWSVNLKSDVERNKQATFEESHIVQSMYRPFCKQWLYFDRRFNERVYQMPKIFPNPQVENLVIFISALGGSKDSSALMTNVIPDLNMQHSGGQGFPLYFYEESHAAGLFDAPTDRYTRRDALSDVMLKEYQKHYADPKISKTDIFYYIYGILHSPSYKSKYAADLKKMLPRIPFAQNFWQYSKAGKQLAHWHLNYETVQAYALEEISSRPLNAADYRVQKMQYAKIGKTPDKSSLIYNANLTLTGIPPETYEYIVNGKSALDWIIERYQITTDKDSGIRNDPNHWSDDPRYIVDLVNRIVTVSVESVKIVNTLTEEF
jgi:predicted helicase